MKTASIALFLATAGMLGNAAAAWPRLPSVGPQPVDLASRALPGTVIKNSEGIGQPQAVLASDPVGGASVPVGASELTISLARQYAVDTARFLNDGVEGKVTVSGSSDATKWVGLGQMEIVGSDRSVPISFAGAQVKYLKIAFQSSKNGSIRNLSVFGAAKARDFHLKFSESSNATSINFADGVGGARPIYAFPTPTNIGEREAATNVFRFPATAEKYRTVVYDLSAPRAIKQFTAAYSAVPVRLEVFAFNELPEGKDWRGKLTLDPSVFDSMSPVAAGEDARGVGNIKLTPSKGVKTRYVAFRFEPRYGKTAATGGSVSDFMNFALLPAEGLTGLVHLGARSQWTAAEDGSFSTFGVGIQSQGSGNYESSPGEQGDEASETKEEGSGEQTDVEDEKALWNQILGNFGAFNALTGSRGASLSGAGDSGSNGNNGNGNGGNGGGGPVIIINPVIPPTAE